MDCNSYSYAPHMLDEPVIEHYENDDVHIELFEWAHSYVVEAYRFDGSMEVYELFDALETAQKLYKYIMDNYSDTPPGWELDVYIKSLHRRA